VLIFICAAVLFAIAVAAATGEAATLAAIKRTRRRRSMSSR
jgi:hypothetical protein